MIAVTVGGSSLLENRVETLLNEIKLAKSGVVTEKTNIIIREVCVDIWNIFLNVNAGNEPHRRPDHACVSRKFFEAWDDCGLRADVMTKIGVSEHRKPMKVVRSEILALSGPQELPTFDSIIKYLKDELKIVWITKEEDQQLNAMGIRSKMPPCGSDRYDLAGIEVWPQMIKYKKIKANLKSKETD